jgi:hypothetical protein
LVKTEVELLESKELSAELGKLIGENYNFLHLKIYVKTSNFFEPNRIKKKVWEGAELGSTAVFSNILFPLYSS